MSIADLPLRGALVVLAIACLSASAAAQDYAAPAPSDQPAYDPGGASGVETPRPRRARRHAKVEEQTDESSSAGDISGRYAVMREKHDTGCMVTLDRARTKGGDRAQLAPGCRDQGIVIFDPSAWQIVKGEMVLTARAGHKTRLERQEDGSWVKSAKDGGKPLGLKKL